MPKVSVIVPNYNHAPYLRQRLDSIFNQTFQDFEVIILDDCSTDSSKEIIEEYRNKSQVSHIVCNKINSGSPFKQWAKGFELAQGEYIWIAESDDWAENSFLEVLVAQMVKDKDVVLGFSNSIWEFADQKKYPSIANENFSCSGSLFIQKWMLYNNFICNASSVVFRKNIATEIDSTYQSFKGSGDYLFWILLMEKHKIFFSKEFLNHYRQHSQNTTKACIVSGAQYKENFLIFNYLQKKGYIGFATKQKIILYYLILIDNSFKNKELSPLIYTEISNLWKKSFFIPFGFFLLKKIKKTFDFLFN